jgi:hypothetical protein
MKVPDLMYASENRTLNRDGKKRFETAEIKFVQLVSGHNF